jgi:hypothetical protein
VADSQPRSLDAGLDRVPAPFAIVRGLEPERVGRPPARRRAAPARQCRPSCRSERWH